MGQQETLHRSCKRTGEICRNITRKEIREIAIQNGWKILPGGKEQLKAYRKGYSSVPLPGHTDSAVIRNGTAYKVIKSLQQPAINDQGMDTKNMLQNNSIYKAKINELEVQLAQVNSTNEKLRDDVEVAFELAAETEKRNIELSKKIYRQKRWIEGLKQEIGSLIQQRAQQDEEMLKIADEVEQKELLIKTGAEKFTQFSRQLKPKLRLDLQQIIQWLTEENT